MIIYLQIYKWKKLHLIKLPSFIKQKKKIKINIIAINNTNERIYNYFVWRWQIQRNLQFENDYND